MALHTKRHLAQIEKQIEHWKKKLRVMKQRRLDVSDEEDKLDGIIAKLEESASALRSEKPESENADDERSDQC